MGNEPWWKHTALRLNEYRDKALIDDLSRFQGRGQRSERMRELMRKGLEAEQRGLLSASPYPPQQAPPDYSLLMQLLLQMVQRQPQQPQQAVPIDQLLQLVQQTQAQQAPSQQTVQPVTENTPAPEPPQVQKEEQTSESAYEVIEEVAEPEPEPKKSQVQIRTQPPRPVVRRTPRFTRSEDDNKSPEERKKEALLRNMGGSFDNLDF